MARPEGVEPPTLCLEGRCSIQLSYGRSLPNFSQLHCLPLHLDDSESLPACTKRSAVTFRYCSSKQARGSPSQKQRVTL